MDQASIVTQGNQRRKAVWLWVVGLGLILFIILPSTVTCFYKAWGISGAIVSALFLPFSILLYPFVMAILGLEHWIIIIINFLFIGISMTMLIFAWVKTYDRNLVVTENSSFKYWLFISLVRIKDFYAWVLLIWIEWLALFFFYVFSVIFILMGPLRQLVFVVSLKSKMWSSDYSSFFSFLLFMFYLQIAIGIPLLTYYYVGNDKLIEGIAVAATVLAFVALQFQKMTPPYFIATYINHQGSRVGDKYMSRKVNTATTICLLLRITNLGITTFKDCLVEVILPKDFIVLDDPSLYKELDFARKFVIVQKYHVLQFSPRDNYMTFSPGNNLIFPIWVSTPQAPPENENVTIKLSTESAWGEHSEKLRMIIYDR